MKKKSFSIMLIVVLIVALVMPGIYFNVIADDEEPGVTWCDGSNIAAGCSMNPTDDELTKLTGKYIDGSLYDGYLYFQVGENPSGIYGEQAIEKVIIEGYGDSSPNDVVSFEYAENKSNPTWQDGTDKFLVTGNPITLINRTIYFRVKFSKQAIYKIHAVYMPASNPVESAGVRSNNRYVKIESDSYMWSQDLTYVDPNPTTTPEQTTTQPQTNVNQYNVDEYKANNSYPTKEGSLFAGWYSDEQCTIPYLESTGTAYARFIDDDVLKVMFQWADNHSALRFVSTLDVLDYTEAGFIINGTYGNNTITNKRKTVSKVYSTITAAGEKISPDLFSSESNYFIAYTVRGMDGSVSSTWSITPFYVTSDGTEVKGRVGELTYTPNN